MGPGELVQIGSRMNSSTYLDILQNVMLPSVRIAYPEGQIYFIQDNCAVHRAQSVTQWLNILDDVTVIRWPSKSPDLNLIENIWGQMVLNWDSSEVRNAQNLDMEVQRSWELMRNSDMCSTMVSGMRDRLQQVIDNNGYPIRY